VADGLHLLQDHRLGMVLPGEHSGRLLAPHHRLEAFHDDGFDRCEDSIIDIAVEKTGVEYVAVRHRPRLLSDNGPA